MLVKLKDANFVNLVGSNVIMSTRINMGNGYIICVGTNIKATISIRNHVIINPYYTIRHDVIIRDFVTLHSGVNISGNIVLEE